MAVRERIQSGNDGEGDREALLSDVEELIQAHLDIPVIQFLGIIDIRQTFPDTDEWRNVSLDVEHEEGS